MELQGLSNTGHGEPRETPAAVSASPHPGWARKGLSIGTFLVAKENCLPFVAKASFSIDIRYCHCHTLFDVF